MKHKKIEFSKQIIIFSWLNAIIWTSMASIMVFVNKDISAFTNIVLASWTEVAGANSFYYWKSKAENMKKLGISLEGDAHNE